MEGQSFVVYVILLSVLRNECNACFKTDTIAKLSRPSGTSFYIECECFEPGYTVDSLKWYKDNEDFPGSDTEFASTEIIDNMFSLQISEIKKSNEGTYQCVTTYEGQTYTQKYELHVYNAVEFINTSDAQYLIKGTTSTIHCNAVGEPSLYLIWHKGTDESEIVNSNKYRIIPGGLEVQEVDDEDTDTYKCTAIVPTTTEEVDKYIKVKVISKPVIDNIRATPAKKVIENQTLILECLAVAIPPPEYIWGVKKFLDNDINNITIERDQLRGNMTENKLIIDTMQLEDEGTYVCTALNLAGEVRKEIDIEVLIPPTITYFANLTVNEGTIVQLDCGVAGKPVPNVSISFLNDEYDEDDKPLVLKSIEFKAERSRRGSYLCNASNEVYYTVQEMYMTVRTAPHIKKIVNNNVEDVWAWYGHNFNLSCVVDSYPRSTVEWSKDGLPIPVDMPSFKNEINTYLVEYYLNIVVKNNTEYGTYYCIAQNDMGKEIKTFRVKKGFTPGPIENVTISSIGTSIATFHLQGPKKVNGPDLSGYTCEYDDEESYNITNVHKTRYWGSERQPRIDNLKLNTTYKIKFAAVNGVGQGPWSDLYKIHTLDKSAPEPPEWILNNSEINAGSNQLLKWKPPISNGAPIDHYQLRHCARNTSLQKELCGEMTLKSVITEIMMARLDYNTSYRFELSAHNSEGYSLPAIAEFTTPVENKISLLSGAAIIGISAIAVSLCLLLVDVLFCFWRRQGIIASCCLKKKKQKDEDNVQSRDKKGLLKDNAEAANDTLKRSNNGHKEYEYNKTTGVITGKHSAV